MKRVGVWINGDLHGVGFRWWAQTLGRNMGLTGTVQNLWGGGVELHIQGDDEVVDKMVAEATSRTPAGRRPGVVTVHVVEPEAVLEGESGFEIV